MAGRVIVLNGTSSSGKTALGRALQEQLADTWLLFGVDTFIDALPWRLFGTADGHTIHGDGSISVGPVFRAEYDRWLGVIASLARAGSNLILDEVFLRGGEEQAQWATLLDGIDVTWVGVLCDVEVAAARELARGDRSVGMARAQARVVHDGVRYDIELNSTSTTPEELAADIAHRLTQ